MSLSVFDRLNTRLESVDEYEREPVPEKELKGWKGFLGQYVGTSG